MSEARVTDYTNDGQQRILKVLLVMFADVVQGVPASAVAKELGLNLPTVLRDLDNLKTAGLAEKDDSTGLWRLTPRLPQQAFKVLSAIDNAQRRVDEVRHRFTRTFN